MLRVRLAGFAQHLLLLRDIFGEEAHAGMHHRARLEKISFIANQVASIRKRIQIEISPRRKAVTNEQSEERYTR